uniref:Uncharacterized protein n=1 Tax=Anguilla anguilla TaxID=7936 RepID=A0A0E9VLA9_ANGAN
MLVKHYLYSKPSTRRH